AGETQATCLYDCTPAGVVDHESAGSSATTMVSAALNGSNIVYAGITTSTSSSMGLSALDTGTKTARDMFIVRGNADGTYGAMQRIALSDADPVAMHASVDSAGAGNVAIATAGVGVGSLRIHNASTLATKWTQSLYNAGAGYRILAIKVEGTSYVHTIGTVENLVGGAWVPQSREYRKYDLTTGTVLSSRSLVLGQTSNVVRMADDGRTVSVRASDPSTLELRAFGAPGQTNLDSTTTLTVPGMSNLAPQAVQDGVFIAGNGTTAGGQPGAFIGRVYSGMNSWAWLTTISPDPNRAVEIQSMEVMGQVVIVMGKFKGPLDFRGSTPTSIPSARAGVNGNEDVFIAAYEVGTGALSWVRTYGGPGIDVPDTFTIDETSRLWLFGRFVGTPRIEGSYVAGRDGDTGTDSMRIVAGPLSLAQSSPIVAGPLASYAVRDGQLWSWGHNSYGNLGLTTLGTISSPTPALSGVVKVGAGVGVVLALRADGTVWAAGDNFAGELGNGTTTAPPIIGSW
ncbi:MAG TPA: hypothetical protein PKA58_37460, partial [Polyangium sp.]|nr:hypothetical protein [Polyangium sp.]